MIIAFQSCMFQKIIFMVVLIIFMFWLAQSVPWSFVISVLKMCIFVINMSGKGGEKKRRKKNPKPSVLGGEALQLIMANSV